MRRFSLLVSFMSETEITVTVVTLVLALLVLAANISLWHSYHKRGEQSRCERQLIKKREEIAKRLENMQLGLIPAQSEHHEAILQAESELDEPEENDEREDGELPEESDITSLSKYPVSDVLAVREMSPALRTKFGLLGEEFEERHFYVSYEFSFEAKLRCAVGDVKACYRAFRDEIALYKGLNVVNGFSQQSIVRGKQTLGLLLFRSNTLCIALALDPTAYANTQYRGIDKSDKIRFAKTPMLFKLNSLRRLEYAKYLLTQIAEANTILMNERAVRAAYDDALLPFDTLVSMGLVRVRLLAEALPEGEECAPTTNEEELTPVAPITSMQEMNATAPVKSADETKSIASAISEEESDGGSEEPDEKPLEEKEEKASEMSVTQKDAYA